MGRPKTIIYRRGQGCSIISDEKLMMLLDAISSFTRGLEKYPNLWHFLFPLLYWLRVQKFVTPLMRQPHERSRDRIEIDITYACNLKCFNCDRSCGIAPSADRLSLEQIQKFLQESTKKGIQWKRIRVLGGEPTLHPEFFGIVNELQAFQESQCPEVAIEVITNGFGKKVNDVLAKLGSRVVVINTAKKSPVQNFHPYNLAPKDFLRNRFVDYSHGCWITRDCGIGLNPHGFYPCGAAGGIDRVFGFDIGRKSLPDLWDNMHDQMEALCRYCGHFKYPRPVMNDEFLMSKSWSEALKKYKVSKPRMTFY